MQALKLKILKVSDKEYINDKINNYNYAFHFLYKKIEEINNPKLVTYIMQRFDLNDIEYRSLLSSVKSFYLRNEKDKQKKLKRIEIIKANLAELKDKNKTKKVVRNIFKLNKKIAYLTKSINNNIVYGGKRELQEITRLYNKKLNKTFVDEDNIKIESKLSIYKENRRQPIFILGESNQKGVRFFDFNGLLENNIIYKPNKTTKINIQIANYKNYKKIYRKLIELSNSKDIPISVSLSNKYIYLIFNEERLNGYNINEKEKLLDVKEVKSQHYNKDYEKLLIKEIYKNHYDDQRRRKLIGKISNRYLGIDLNPNYIGYSIIDKINNTENRINVIHTGSYSLKGLSKKLGVCSDDSKQKKQNNKKKYEIYQIIKNLIGLCLHYKVGYICIEELNFRIDETNNKNKEANRQTKNLWYRTIITNNLNKKCNETGIQIIEVNPVLSSYIGNMMYNYIDCINASIEIARRGAYKYIKNKFYPLITDTILNTVETLNGKDVLDIKGGKMTWLELYHSSGFRWRKTLKESKFDFERLRLFAYSSGVKVIKNYERIQY